MNNKPSGRSPYEIRLELLQLAQIILNERHKAIGVLHHTGRATTSPTTEEIIAEADKLNTFVSKTNSNQ